MSGPRAAGLLLGYLADRTLGDPRSFHPVAGFGMLATSWERRIYADDRPAGVLFAGTLVGGVTVLGVIASRWSKHSSTQMLLTAAATWAVLGGRSLEREATAVGNLLASADLPAARLRLTHLVGRRTEQLEPAGVARAVVESVAENTADAVVAPLVWGALLGVPGLLGYRAANTLDAMVGHRNDRYENFGWASARLDDVLNVPGARLAAALAIVLRPATATEAVAAWRRDAPLHPSPNAGVVEAVFAGSLGVRLGGPNQYGDRIEHRVVLGRGRAVEPSDIQRANRLASQVGLASVLVSSLVALRNATAAAGADSPDDRSRDARSRSFPPSARQLRRTRRRPAAR